MATTEREGKKAGEKDSRKKAGGFGEAVKVIINALILALIVRTFLFQPFNIPSGSMIPTLLIGDYLFVSKYSYGYSRHSIPFSPPVFSGRIWPTLPERGDVAVFKLPRDGTSDYIKRIIGLPGDRVQMINGVLYINDRPVPRDRVGDFGTRNPFGRQVLVPEYRETLPNGVEYITLDMDPASYADNTTVFTVPEAHYFMMGDNRDNSSDSRVSSAVGFVPFENFVGRAEVIFFSIDEDTHIWEFWKWPTAIRWDRLFQSVD
jgi:signal peptidase I